MKINIDTEDFFTTRRIAWALILLAVGVLIYHLGFIAGTCHARKHMERMYGGQKFFDARMQGGMPMQDVMYYHGEAMMGAGAAPAMPMYGGKRVIKMDDGLGEQRVIYFKSQ